MSNPDTKSNTTHFGYKTVEDYLLGDVARWSVAELEHVHDLILETTETVTELAETNDQPPPLDGQQTLWLGILDIHIHEATGGLKTAAEATRVHGE